MEEGTKILSTVDGILRTVTESSFRRNLKLQDDTGFNEFSSNIATALVCLATNRTYNFSKMIFDGLVKNLKNKGEGSSTPTEPHHTPSPEAHPTSHKTPSSPTLPHVTTASIPTITPSETTPIRQYTRRARIAQSSALPTIADEPASSLRDVIQGEACSTDSGFKVDQDRANIAKTSTFPHDSALRVTSHVIAKGNMQQSLNKLTAFCTILQSLVFATATVVTPYRRRKGKKIMVESKTLKKKKSMIDGLDISNETVAKYLQECQQFASELPLERRIELISDLVRNQDNYAKVHKFQAQQRKPWSKKQKTDYYMDVIRSNLGWKVKDFRGMTFEEIEATFTTFWKQLEDFIPMGSKEEAERLKRKGLSLEQESAKKLKTSDEVPEEVNSPVEVPEEKVKEMMQLVPIEEVYIEALQVKHLIIDWKVHTEGQRSYWKIIRLGGSSASYQFFVDLLKHMDREDLNQLWALVKESFSNRQPTSDKEMELWVELKSWSIKFRGGLLGIKCTSIPTAVIDFPLAEEVLSAIEESCHCQKKKEATAVKIALLLKSRRNYQSKSDDSYAKLVPHVTPCNLGITIIVTSCTRTPCPIKGIL
nr:hypothetical protein [Tanacetum cinerariifolium]